MSARKERKPLGRPRAFDTGQALDKAVRLFWRHGYEATSVSDLVAEIGVGAASLYSAFGNKEQLFKATVERYAATFSVVLYGPINDPSLTTFEAVQGLFKRAAQLFSEPETPAGCFMFSAAAAVSPSSASIEKLLREKRAAAEARLAERIADGVNKGELGREVEPVALARFLNSVLQGMSVQARDGATRAELLDIAKMALAVLPAQQGHGRKSASRRS